MFEPLRAFVEADHRLLGEVGLPFVHSYSTHKLAPSACQLRASNEDEKLLEGGLPRLRMCTVPGS